jgi:hypothetical protein
MRSMRPGGFYATLFVAALSVSKTSHMRRFTTPALLVILILFACQKKDGPGLHGTYTEHSPVAGRSQLEFIGDGKLVKREPASSFCDTFAYSLNNGKIILTPAWTNQYLPQEFDFEMIDNKSFKIENLYPSIGIQAGQMIFKK